MHVGPHGLQLNSLDNWGVKGLGPGGDLFMETLGYLTAIMPTPIFRCSAREGEYEERGLVIGDGAGEGVSVTRDMASGRGGETFPSLLCGRQFWQLLREDSLLLHPAL